MSPDSKGEMNQEATVGERRNRASSALQCEVDTCGEGRCRRRRYVNTV